MPWKIFTINSKTINLNINKWWINKHNSSRNNIICSMIINISDHLSITKKKSKMWTIISIKWRGSFKKKKKWWASWEITMKKWGFKSEMPRLLPISWDKNRNNQDPNPASSPTTWDHLTCSVKVEWAAEAIPTKYTGTQIQMVWISMVSMAGVAWQMNNCWRVWVKNPNCSDI